MIAVNYSQIRENMKTYMDKTVEDYETIIITRKNNKNVVMLSEEAFNNLLENLYLNSNEINFKWLIDSKKQYDNKEIESHQLIEEE